jgi:nucleotide-binding universal stress UspA family protein
VSVSLFERALVPVASEEDATTTLRALRPYLESRDCQATLLTVVEKAGGAPDKASVDQRERGAEETFAAAREAAGDVADRLDTRIAYGTDVPGTIIEVAHDVDASAIVFTPRGGSRWVRLLTGDVALSLLTDSDLPVVTLPDND